jgi:GTPase involved in cell partitioning and DNA repair
VALDYAQEMHLSQTEGAQVLNERIKGLEALLKAKDEMIYANKQELESYKEREQSFRLILEDKRQKKRWWPFSKS